MTRVDGNPLRRRLVRPALVLGAASLACLAGPAAAAALADEGPAAAAADPAGIATVIVSARRRDESIMAVPASVTVFGPEALEDFAIHDFADYATKTPNLSFGFGSGSTGVADARTVAIRGITGQNLFGTSGSTGFYIDDTPLPGSIDPRVVDLEDIEVLKGPQGTLFGESSLGGNVRLITRQPSRSVDELAFKASVGLTSGGGSVDGGASVVVNRAVVPDVLGIRAVLFADHAAGYLSRTYPDPSSPAATDPFLVVPRARVGDQGAVDTAGGSVAAFLRLAERLDAKLRIMFQHSVDRGFPAAFAPLPAFTPVYTLDRAFNVQPRASDDWALPSLELDWHGTGWSLVSSTSVFARHAEDREDSTYGTQQILGSYYGVAGLPAQPYLWTGEHYLDQLTEELRMTFDPRQDLSGTVGAFFARTHTRFAIPPQLATGLPGATAGNAVVGPWPNDLLFTQNNPGLERDFSLFGEAYYKLPGHLTLTLGARQYWLRQDTDFTADGFLDFGAIASDPQHNRQSGLNPKLGISYQPDDRELLYLSASRGFRAGGAQPYVPICALPDLPVSDITRLKSDTLWSYEAGGKLRVPGTGLLVTAAAFHIDWRDPQQQVALPCGVYFEINGGAARIDGGEIEVSGRIAPGLELRFGAGYEATAITRPGPLGDAGVASGTRIPGTPAASATLGLVYTRPLARDVDGFAAADYSYTGNSVSLLNGGTGQEAVRPAYALANLRMGIAVGRSEFALQVRNLTNARPNLGDLGYVGYAQYDRTGILPQVATLQPLTVTVSYGRKF